METLKQLISDCDERVKEFLERFEATFPKEIPLDVLLNLKANLDLKLEHTSFSDKHIIDKGSNGFFDSESSSLDKHMIEKESYDVFDYPFVPCSITLTMISTEEEKLSIGYDLYNDGKIIISSVSFFKGKQECYTRNTGRCKKIGTKQD